MSTTTPRRSGSSAGAHPIGAAVRQGLVRAWLEWGHLLRNGQDLLGNGIWLAGMIVPILYLRDNDLPGSPFSVATFILPGIVSMAVGFYGIFSLAQQLVAERQDGTLLRLKAIPHGMVSYLVGKIVYISGIVLVASAVVVAVAVASLDDVRLDLDLVLTLAWAIPLSLLAVLPAGAVLGSLVATPRNMNLVMLPLALLAGLSGIFFPLSQLPVPLQVVAMVFPLYWIALAARSALLPDSAVAAEIGDSWQQWETAAVLGVWAVVGLVVAPVVLRRAARRESGSTMQRRREQAMAGPT